MQKLGQRTGTKSGGHWAAYLESGLVALLVCAALGSIPGFGSRLAHIATSFVANLAAD